MMSIEFAGFRGCFIALAVVFLCSLTVVDAQTSLKFDLGAGKNIAGRTLVQATDIYSKEKGYGFEPGAEIECSAIRGKTNSGYCGSNKPFYFSAAVPEGNYKVTITFGNKIDASVTTVKAELRRLMLEKVETKKGTICDRLIYRECSHAKYHRWRNGQTKRPRTVDRVAGLG